MKLSELCLTKKGKYSKRCLRRNLKKLRSEITLNSIFYMDYENSFDIDEHDCCNFFDGFIEHCKAIEVEKYENGDALDVNEFFDEFDTIDNLVDWYMSIEF